MDAKKRKIIEELLIRSTTEVLNKNDETITFLLAKNIKNHSKDLAKKFIKTQKSLAKQAEEMEKIQKENSVSNLPKATISKIISKPKNKVIAKKTDLTPVKTSVKNNVASKQSTSLKISPTKRKSAKSITVKK